MMPIVVAMLRFIDIEDISRSVFGSALLLAVAWGTSVGGSGTPVGGAPNLLTVQFIESQLIDHEFLFTTWVTRILPLTVLTAVVAFVFMRFAFRPEMDRVEGTHEYFRHELNKLGRIRNPEWWGLALFALATVLAFTRQLYAEQIPGLTPAFAFLVCAVLVFVVRHKGEPLLTWEYAQGRMVWGLIYLFAGGSALGQILSETGTAQFLAEQLVGMAVGGGLIAIIAFVVLTVGLSQITSNTAAVAIVVPITISTFESAGLNAIPMVYIVAAAGNYGLILPSSSGGCAVAAGYGVNLRMMSVWGFVLTGLVILALIAGGYVLATFWPGFGIA
jgi:sodium-dependent dicarboxylate transporter 2/3/5